MKRKKNAGFTLVELLVSIAVLSIVTLGIGGLLRLAAEQYSNATKETEVQNLLQSTFASLSNSLEDAAIDVIYDNSNKRLTVVNQDKFIQFQLSGSSLYYDEGTYSAGDLDDDGKKAEAAGHTPQTQTENLLADHVQSFNVDTSSKAQGFVVLDVTVTYHERSKNLIQNVFMRNLRPKSSDQLANNTTTPTTSPTTGPTTTPPTNPPTTAPTTGPGPGPGPGPSNPTSTPVPTSTPMPTSTPVAGGTAGARVKDFDKEESANWKRFTFNLTHYGSAVKIEVIHLKNPDQYTIRVKHDDPQGNSSNYWMLAGINQQDGGGTTTAMPGFNWNQQDFNINMNTDEFNWFMDNFGIDVKDELGF